MISRSARRASLAAGVAASALAIATFVGGVSMALLSATETSSGNSFTAGRVTVGLDSGGTQVTCTISNMNPGDSSVGAGIGNHNDSTCRYQVTYNGNVNARLAVDVTVANGSTALYDGTVSGLQFYLKDTSTTYLTSTATDAGTGAGTTYTNPSGAATSLPSTGVANLLVDAAAGGSAPGTIVHFDLDYALPASTPTAYQGGSATVTLTFHAVQATNNNLPAACTTAGRQCPPSGNFGWS